MYNLNITAANVTTWDFLGVDLPEELTKLFAARDAFRKVETELNLPELGDLTEDDDLGVVVSQLAEHLSVAAHYRTARQQVSDVIDRGIVHAVGDAVTVIREQLTKTFDEAAADFRSSVERLPDPLTAETLVEAGPDALAAFQSTKAAAAELAKIDGWLASLSQLPQFAGHKPDPNVRITAPKDRTEYAAVAVKQREPLVQQLGEQAYNAARAGVEFRMMLPAETTAQLEEINATVRKSTAKSVRL